MFFYHGLCILFPEGVINDNGAIKSAIFLKKLTNERQSRLRGDEVEGIDKQEKK
jgi:hypothetical protein